MDETTRKETESAAGAGDRKQSGRAAVGPMSPLGCLAHLCNRQFKRMKSTSSFGCCPARSPGQCFVRTPPPPKPRTRGQLADEPDSFNMLVNWRTSSFFHFCEHVSTLAVAPLASSSRSCTPPPPHQHPHPSPCCEPVFNSPCVLTDILI